MEQSLKNKAPDLAGGKIGKLILRFSVPCVLSLIVGALYNIVDQIFIGQGVGYLGNAATNVVCPVTIISLGLALWVGDGCAATYSLCQGKGEVDKGHKIIGGGILVAAVITIVITIIGFALKRPILYVFGATDVIYGYCDDYMTYIMIGLPFYMFTNVLNPVIRADGSPRYALFTVVVGAVLNIILDPIAIFVLHAGVKGAAIATVIGQVVSFLLSILYFIRPKTFKLTIKSFKPDVKLIGRTLAAGLTSLLTQLAIMVIMAVMNNILSKYGALSRYGAEIPLSVIGIVMKVFQIVVSVVIGIAVGAQPVVGYNYGAGNLDRVLKTYKVIVLSSLSVCLVATVLFEACPMVIVKIFGSESELYDEYAVRCFRVFLSTIALCGVTKASLIFMQAIGKPVQSTMLSLIRDIVLMVPLSYLLSAVGKVGVETVLWSAPIADAICLVITAAVVAAEIKKIRKRLASAPHNDCVSAEKTLAE